MKNRKNKNEKGLVEERKESEEKASTDDIELIESDVENLAEDNSDCCAEMVGEDDSEPYEPWDKPFEQNMDYEMSLRGKYLALKDFLSENGLNLLGDIDIFGETASFTEDDSIEFDFAFEKPDKIEFREVIDVREYFEELGFSVCSVEYRDYRTSHQRFARRIAPVCGSYGRSLAECRDFYVVRVCGSSSFFKKAAKGLADSAKETGSQKNTKKRGLGIPRLRARKILIACGIIAAFLISVFLVLPDTSGRKGKARPYEPDSVGFEIDDKTEKLPESMDWKKMPLVDLEVQIPPVRYDLTFDTVSGPRKFWRADYEKKWFKYHITSYDRDGEAWKWDEIPVWNVRSISKMRNFFDRWERDFDEERKETEEKFLPPPDFGKKGFGSQDKETEGN